jgi:hypothetical protein
MSNIKKQLIASSKAGNFLVKIFTFYSQEKNDQKDLEKHLIDLHNTGKINIIKEFHKLKNIDEAYNFFKTREILEPVLPKISAPANTVMECVKHLISEAGNDMAADTLIAPFIEFMAADEKRADEVLNISLEEIDEKFDSITPAILAGAKLNLKVYASKTIELSQHSNIQIQTRAIHAIGRIDYNKDNDLIVNAITAIESSISNNFNELLFATVLRSSYSLCNHNSVLDKRVAKIFKTVLKNHNDHILHIASSILGFENNIPNPIVKLLLGALTHTKPQNKGTLLHIDCGLKKLLEKNQAKEIDNVIIFLEKILLKESNISITQFISVQQEIICNAKILNKIVTKWLLSKKSRLGKAASDLVSNISQQPLHLSVDRKKLPKLDNDTYLFLAKKACGWFFFQPVSAVSFILSLLDKAPENERQKIAEIVFNPLLISYPGSVKEYLESMLPNASKIQAPIISTVIKRFENYHNELEKAQKTRELIPSVAHREIYHRYHTRMMEQSMQEAEKDSLFSHLVTKKLILYGNKAINYFKLNPEEIGNRQEMELQSHSLSVEVPTMEYLNSNGLEYIRLNFQLEGCTS